jgi:microcystin-dependent protein
MSGLDKVRSVSSEPVIAPTLQSENLYAQTVTATNLIVENSVILPESYVPTSNILRWSRVAVGGETIISGKDLSNNPLIYEPGYEQVYLNGSLLLRGIDYIATNGTTITGLGALLASDVIEVIAPSGVAVGDYYTQSQADAKFATTNQTSTPVASVLSYAAANAPSGWLLCDGTVYSFAAYPLLASLLLGTYGGNGTTTFAVPDLRGRAVAGRDNMGGTTASRITAAVSGVTGTTLGAAGGTEKLHQHTHAGTFAASDHGHGPGSFHAAIGATDSDPSRIGYVAGYNSGGPGIATYSIIAGGLTINTSGFNHYTPVYGGSGSPSADTTVGITNNVNAQTGASQNLPPTIVLNYIIKA